MTTNLTPVQCDLLLDLFEHCTSLQLAYQRKEQAESSSGEGAEALAKQYDREIERHDFLMQECATHGVPAERVGYVLDTYLPAHLQSVAAN